MMLAHPLHLFQQAEMYLSMGRQRGGKVMLMHHTVAKHIHLILRQFLAEVGRYTSMGNQPHGLEMQLAVVDLWLKALRMFG